MIKISVKLVQIDKKSNKMIENSVIFGLHEPQIDRGTKNLVYGTFGHKPWKDFYRIVQFEFDVKFYEELGFF